MDQLKQMWKAFIDFLVTYDSNKITEILRNVKWEEVPSNPYVWLIGGPILLYLLIKKRFKTLVLLSSLGVLLYLLEITLPASEDAIPFEKLMTFLAVTVALVALNLYFLFMRGD